MYETILDRMKETQGQLRQKVLAAVFYEYDERIMGLDLASRQTKYAKMAENAFSFYRGSAYLFYLDAVQAAFAYHTPEDRPTWIQGDLHFENFGAFRNEEGRIVYDVNDFDEGYWGSYLYDVLRMSVSLGLVCGQLGWDVKQDKAPAKIIRAYLRAYYRQMQLFADGQESPVKLVYDEEGTRGPIRKLLKKLNKRSGHKLLQQLTDAADSSRNFVWSEQLQPLEEREREQLELVWSQYVADKCSEGTEAAEFYRIKDIAVKHGSGTASIGLDRYYILIEGGRHEAELDDIVLEAKEVRAAIPSYFLPKQDEFMSRYQHQGQRVIATQQAMHHMSDPHLGVLILEGRDFYVRERSPYKKKLKLSAVEELEELQEVVDIMGRITAKIHARADADVERGLLPYHSELEIQRAMGDSEEQFVDELTQWALAYTKQVEKDYQMFCEWVEAGCPNETEEGTSA